MGRRVEDRQLQLVMIQSAMNKKQQLITLLTQTIKKSHETKNSVLRNLA